jgi:SNF2 family DNA or RNA helicase
MKPGAWMWSEAHRQRCQVIESQSLWGKTVCRVWLPTQDAIVRLPAEQLKPLDAIVGYTPTELTYIAAAAKIADALTQDVLLAPIESTVIPLPHQIKALSTAVSNDKIRYLLADEVGLGKTIEAGLIMRELKLRGLVKRILVVAPKGLVTQWVSEMQLHFNETFQLVRPEDLKTLQSLSPQPNSRLEPKPGTAANPWQLFHQVVCPMDSVKPLDQRRGWSRQQISDYNQERFGDLIAAGWDLVVVDEAHRLGGSSDQVARYRLGQGLAEAAPYLLLLSATPHQGKTDAFYRLVSLLDPAAFPNLASLNQERVKPYVIRTEKRWAIDAQGNPLFKPRRTQLVPVSWKANHRDQQRLYEAVTDYVREGYNQSIKQKKSYIGFLMILMQRLVTSSTRAIRTTLERRLEALQEPEEQLSLFPMVSEDEWADMDGQEQVDALLTTRLKALKNERAEVELLLEVARRSEAINPDAKAEALLEWIYRLQQEEADSNLKVLVFTEFVPTQEMLREFLSDRGISVVCLNGSLGMAERKQIQDAFAQAARVLISTDAGGEGLNLQFCHVVVNYDIPWNPMRLEQRIGRVDRIGQKHPVQALNFVFEGTVEYRVREVLEEKLTVILKEFGVDKAGDVLDSAQAGELFDTLYIETLLNPTSLETKVDAVISQVQEQVKTVRESAIIYSAEEPLDPLAAQQLLEHPINDWVEQMTISYLESHSGMAEKKGKAWNLHWETGEEWQNVVFTLRDAAAVPLARHVTLEDPQIRGLTTRIPQFLDGQPIPCLKVPELAVEGFWSLWRIVLSTPDWTQQRVMPLFLNDQDRVFLPTARHLWEHLLSSSPTIHSYLQGELATTGFQRVWDAAINQGQTTYEELVQQHQTYLTQEQEKGDYAFAARRRAIERIGLPQVREHRLALLKQEEQTWREQLCDQTRLNPELVPLLLVYVGGSNNG